MLSLLCEIFANKRKLGLAVYTTEVNSCYFNPSRTLVILLSANRALVNEEEYAIQYPLALIHRSAIVCPPCFG